MYTIVKNGNKENYGVNYYIADTQGDLQNITSASPGSKAFVVGNENVKGKNSIKGVDGVWVEHVNSIGTNGNNNNIDLSDYITKDTYASTSSAGLVRVSSDGNHPYKVSPTDGTLQLNMVNSTAFGEVNANEWWFENENNLLSLQSLAVAIQQLITQEKYEPGSNALEYYKKAATMLSNDGSYALAKRQEDGSITVPGLTENSGGPAITMPDAQSLVHVGEDEPDINSYAQLWVDTSDNFPNYANVQEAMF